ncbi:MAG: formate acetyltransferase [Bacteroidales bacterium]|jgi:formate C-acetyltransferase|nr:formate acetyltransferase [Bacteroidales bacterium]
MKTFDEKLASLRKLKLAQTQEKIALEGLLDEDDYGRIVPPKGFWKIIPNHQDGSFYGFDAWANNFCDLMEKHPVYVNSDDAFAGRWMYFMSKMRPNKWNPEYPYDHLKPDIKKYDIICGIGDDAHFAPDYEMGVQLGWGGLLDKIEHYRSINTSPAQQHFYDLHIKVIKGIQGWIRRHIEKANEMAMHESNSERKQNLLDIAQTNQNILVDAPKTLREACQWIIWFHLASRTYNRDGAGGQLDSLLLPFYEHDIAENNIDDFTTIYYLGCFLINDPVYWQIGGPDKNGKDQTSKISFLLLEAADKINTSLNITVRVHDGINPELLDRSVYYLVKNKNAWPRFSGDKALVKGFMSNGFSVELARQRIAVGCNWMSLPGLEYTMNDLVKVNMAKVFEVAYYEMIAQPDSEYSTGKLWKLFEMHLTKAVEVAAAGIRHHLKYQKYNEPELLLNLLSHGPIEKGLDVSDGGAQYYNLAIDGAGLAIVADSFAALEQRIETEHLLDWDEMTTQLKADFKTTNGQKIQAICRNSERYGATDSLGEKWGEQIRDIFTDLVCKQSNPALKQVFIPGFFSWANTVGFGLSVGATPNGRNAKTPISHGANPNPGFIIEGASLSLATTIAKMQPAKGNTAPMQWELDPTFAKEENVNLIKAIIKTHFRMGGTLINVNIMDKKKILEAHKDPSKYPELVVRVTGFTAYFAMLSPQFRQLVVDRILES